MIFKEKAILDKKDMTIEVFFKNETGTPLVSIILLDWSCRESFHTFHYLNNQTVPREHYEIIWIEYYGKRPHEIADGLQQSEKDGKPPILDKWIVMNMPENIYYHKHLMYNIGFAVSRGEIVVICDSDAIVKPTFVESIIKTFKKHSNIVLHMDEVRNIDERFYPFNFPFIEDILGKGCINWAGGTTTGILEKKNPIHSRNYGACMCALRKDIIDIGGADEHIDYLGHICGPYELTFRLVNKGKKEVWHKKEFLYHVWHPGTDGRNNYLGPHDGKNVSTTALEAIRTKRILPILENPVIKQMRSNRGKEIAEEAMFLLLIDKNLAKSWSIDENKFLMSLGRIAYHRKEYDEAIGFWGKLTDPLNFDSNFLSEFGWAYYFKAEYDKAIDIFSKALQIKDDHQDVLVGLGWTYIQKGAFFKAKTIFQKAIRIMSSKNSPTLKDAFRGLTMAQNSIWQGASSHLDSNNKLAERIKHIRYRIAEYSSKVVRRINRRDFSIPKSLRQRIRRVIFNKVDVLNMPLMKGEREYIDFNGYPCDVPAINIKPNLDFLLLELPPRYMPLMPNGLGYVHNILMKCGIHFQTVDANITLYHKYHERRLREKLNPVITPSGYKMAEDPWDNTNMGEWDRPEVIDYFMPDIEELIEKIVRNKPGAVGISLSGNNRALAKKFVKSLRERMPDVVIVVGGYDCVYYGLGQYLFPDFDYMAVGEAELTLEPLAKALARGDRPKDLAGIVSRYDSPGRVWEKTPLLQDLDTIDFPRYQWANHVWYQDYERKHLIPITASRGCNWARCRFCGECFPFRRRNPVKVADEIEHHTKYGFHTFHFNESDVNGDPQALHDLCSEVIKRKLHLKFVAQLRIDKRNTLDYFRHLALAGFTHLRFGVDGWTDKLIRLQNKGYNLEIVFQNLRDCHAVGITTTVNMVIGVPGETESDVDEAIKNIIRCKKYISIVESFNTLLLVCGSEYHRNPDRYKIRFRKVKEEIYRTYVHYVPSELWYSEDPYIDQAVRMQRLERILSVLYKNGVNIGSFASKVVENLRAQYNPETTGRPSK